MNELLVSLANGDGLRLTLPVFRATRTTGDENEGREAARQMADLDHAPHAPWAVTFSRWAS